MGRRLVDMAIYLIVGALFADHACANETKQTVLRRWLAVKMPELKMDHEIVTSGDRTAITEFEALAGPLPVIE